MRKALAVGALTLGAVLLVPAVPALATGSAAAAGRTPISAESTINGATHVYWHKPCHKHHSKPSKSSASSPSSPSKSSKHKRRSHASSPSHPSASSAASQHSRRSHSSSSNQG